MTFSFLVRGRTLAPGLVCLCNKGTARRGSSSAPMCLYFCWSRLVSYASGGDRPDFGGWKISAQTPRGRVGLHALLQSQAKICGRTIHNYSAHTARRDVIQITMAPEPVGS